MSPRIKQQNLNEMWQDIDTHQDDHGYNDAAITDLYEVTAANFYIWVARDNYYA